MAEPFSWKSVLSHLPVLNIQTTATRAALLTLPPGRHVLRFSVRAPLGYHIHLCSTVPFIFGDEETVMAHLDKESLRFTEQAFGILRAMGKVVNAFSNEQDLPLAMKELVLAHCPPLLHVSGGVKRHFENTGFQQVFNKAVFRMMTAVLDHTPTAEEMLALRALTNDPYLGRERKEATSPGTKENINVSKVLQKMWAVVESAAEKHAVSLLRHIFSNSERSAQLYSCHGDEATRVPFADYSVTFLDQTRNSWFLVFREVFFVPKDMLVVPKVFSPVPACLLHVINNDTAEEVPRIFQKVEPHIYKQNQRGYTFVAEANSRDTPVPGGKWRIRLMGSHELLPVLGREVPLSSFCIKEFRDYYIPNDKNLICRFSVKVKADHMSTIQIQTSKPDVYIKLAVLDHESEVASKTGKGCAVIPVYQFSSNGPSNSSSSESSQGCGKQDRSSSASSQRGGRLTGTPQGGGMEEVSGKKPAEILNHKYIIQAEVLQKTWALDESETAFVHGLKDTEGTDTKEKPEDPSVSGSMDTQSSESQKSATPKSNRKGKEKEKEKPAAKPGSRQETQSLDTSKPQWTLRIVCDQSDADSVEVRRDTERADEIRAMQRAWEAAEPGRAIKAMQARLQFINKSQRRVSMEDCEDTKEPAVAVAAEGGADTAAEPVGPDVPPSPRAKTAQTQPAIHNPMDFTPFIRQSRREPLVKDESIAEEQRRDKAERIQGFRLIRDTILEHRKQEQLFRRELKRRQLEMYKGLQAALDQERRRILQAREAYCGRLQEAELKRAEDSVLEVVQQVELEQNTPQPQATSRKQPKSAGKKK
ncbi:hypothetical protein JZ751_005204 [Albula glossodonta]|uniref:Globin domain-containing protein n=1 Tax=Albula glossodonta TaxID=121402 RepID=A0A8T2P2J9_9TELE|nr:hypothetical protein JZ751_005204 [Albula glossodonta]